MKNIHLHILLILTLILAGCASKETVKKEEKSNNKTVTEPPSKVIMNYEMKERELIKSQKVRSIEKIRFIYDKSGKPIRDSKLSTTNYDKNGFSTKAVFYEKEKVKSTYSYKYDKNGNRIETIQSDKDNNPLDKFSYEYDNNGNKVKAVRLGSNGEMENYYTYEYDDENNLTEEKWFDAEGKEEYRIKYKYDDGKKIEANSFDEKGNRLFKYVYKYDDAGNLVEEIQYDGDIVVSIVQYVYKY